MGAAICIKVVQVGVTVYRFVCLSKARHWLIHTLKNNRGRGSIPQADKADNVTLTSTDTTASRPPTAAASTENADRGQQPQASDPGKDNSVRSEPVSANPAVGVSAQGEGLGAAEDATSVSQMVHQDEKSSDPQTKKADAGSTQEAGSDSAPQAENVRSEGVEASLETSGQQSAHSETPAAAAAGVTASDRKEEYVEPRRTRKKRPPAKTWEISPEDPAEVQPNSTYEKVRLYSRLWRRPEGGLNTKIVHEYLNSLLLHLLQRPGVSVQSLTYLYKGFFSPIDIRDLLEILQQLGCVKLMMMKKPPKVSLFSTTPCAQISQDFDLLGATMDEVIVEPTVDCSHRLGQFLDYIK